MAVPLEPEMENKDPKIHFAEDSVKYSPCFLYLDNIRFEIETLGVCDEVFSDSTVDYSLLFCSLIPCLSKTLL